MSPAGEAAKRGALDGLLVVDFTSMVAGPWCTRLMADCGAEVVKVEPVGDGDILRFAPPLADDMSRVYAHFNAGKKSISLNLKSQAGRDMAKDLIAKADVLVENFRPGVMARLGLDFDAVRAVNHDLIYCSISGFGQTGPLSGNAAYAPVVHAFSGFDLVQAQAQGAGSPPANCGVMIADVLAASYAFGAIQTSLLRRERFGGGEHIDVTLLESMMSLVAIQYQEAQSEQPIRSFSFEPLPTCDGHVTVALVSVRSYLGVYDLIGKSEWAALPDFNTLGGIDRNRATITAALTAWTRSLSSTDCEQRLTEAGVPCSVFYTPAQMLDHPHLTQRGSFAGLEDANGPFRVLNAPFQMTESACKARPFVARPGEHNQDIAQHRLGLDAAAYARLTDEKAFG